MLNKTKCFKIHLTFGIKNIDSNIEKFTKNNSKGYVCVVDINVLSMTFTDPDYFKIVNNATFNTCDGGFLAFLKNIKSKESKKYHSYNGPEIFKKYIIRNDIKQLLIGSNSSDFKLLKNMIPRHSHLYNMELPFKDVDQFNYNQISKEVNKIKPQIIWVMLGAPKQEIFISKIYPLLENGLIFGSGAALNFFFNRINNRAFSIYGMRFIWLERIFYEPKKQLKRIFIFLKVLPKIIKYI